MITRPKRARESQPLTMTPEESDDFVDFMRAEAGEYLRSVIYFDGQEHDLAYVRSDVEGVYTDRERERIVQSLLAESSSRNREEDLYVHGDLNCIVRSFDAAIELHFPEGVYSGTAVALDREAARDLSGLIASVVARTTFEEPISDDGEER